jgi:hypothetical protein
LNHHFSQSLVLFNRFGGPPIFVSVPITPAVIPPRAASLYHGHCDAFVEDGKLLQRPSPNDGPSQPGYRRGHPLIILQEELFSRVDILLEQSKFDLDIG